MSEQRADSPVDKAVAESVEQMAAMLDRHKQLLAIALSTNTEVRQEKCISVTCPCRRLLRETVAETIVVLDETRKSFKSKQLAELRHKLLRLLIEHG